MSVREGSINNTPKNKLQAEAIKVFLLFDLIFFCVLFAFVFLYILMTPFSEAFLGAIGFIFMAITSAVCFIGIRILGKIYDWYIFSRYEQLSMYEIKKILDKNGLLIFLSFVFVWGWALFSAPDNIYYTDFKPNIISWLDQGKCNEIKKYDDNIASFCGVMTRVKNNVRGSFVVLNKNLTADATGCTYMLQSDNNGAIVVTNRPQSCDIVRDQKVFIGLHPFISAYDSGNGDRYAYTLEVSLTP